MIRSFKDKTSEAVSKGKAPKGFPPDLVRSAQRKLFMIDNAAELADLKTPPGNRLEALKATVPVSIRSASTISSAPAFGGWTGEQRM